MTTRLADEEMRVIGYAAMAGEWAETLVTPLGVLLTRNQDALIDACYGDTGAQPTGDDLISLMAGIKVVDGLLGTNQAARIDACLLCGAARAAHDPGRRDYPGHGYQEASCHHPAGRRDSPADADHRDPHRLGGA
jgi:hypothetical protein